MRRRKFAIAASILLLLGAAFALLKPTSPPEPTYKGYKLSEVITHVNRPAIGSGKSAISEAEEAARTIGTNGIPFYLKWMCEQPSQLIEKPRRWAWRHGIKIRNPKADRPAYAATALWALKENGAGAIPTLTQLAANSADRARCTLALLSLGKIGEPARPALSALSTNQDRYVSTFAQSLLQDPDRLR